MPPALTGVNPDKDVYVVTGFQSGMGEDFGKKVVNDGKRAILVGRRPLDPATAQWVEQHQDKVSYVQVSDAGDEAEMRKVAEQLHGKFGTNYQKLYLVLAAGSADPKQAEANKKAFDNGVKAFLPDLRGAAHRGSIVVGYSSVVAKHPQIAPPKDKPYQESKLYVADQAAALRGDTENGNFKVLTLFPGLFFTAMTVEGQQIIPKSVFAVGSAAQNGDASLRLGLAAYIGASSEELFQKNAGQILGRLLGDSLTTPVPEATPDREKRETERARLQSVLLPKIQTWTAKESMIAMSIIGNNSAMQQRLAGFLNFLDIGMSPDVATSAVEGVINAGADQFDEKTKKGELELYSANGDNPILRAFGLGEGEAIPLKQVVARMIVRTRGMIPIERLRGISDRILLELRSPSFILSDSEKIERSSARSFYSLLDGFVQERKNAIAAEKVSGEIHMVGEPPRDPLDPTKDRDGKGSAAGKVEDKR